MWDPTTYLRYGDERSRPFHDLLARVGAERPRAVVDLGCGPGTLTATLAGRWPGSRITGLDSSVEMIDEARARARTRVRALAGAGVATEPVTFTVGDVRAWHPAPDVDVVVCNAVLQWVPDHQELLTRWAAELPSGAWLAIQVPGNFAAPSHRALREVARRDRWRDTLAPLLREAPVDDPTDYAALLVGAGCAVDAWETTYVHLLPAAADADHPVLTWMEGTALRPVRAALDAAGWADFRAELGVRLAQAYPVRQGQVYFPFRRIFVVARTGARAEENS
ncbi:MULTISPECIES: trans-aconitate 2-methyltransferase [Micromonospora]|uniref:Trans-aconitate 2-methyltransferase n=1 Tax=Micromonospora solifontis TaxID=2487138 RepID=A0ABX9WBN1_9ACTN|nr:MULTISPECIES: trans-aconitate 2-methyltransferase [Micromonospora]NES13397.1 trans-aconitate 2-methyltransferase [Micromonospora sp. PPF5-17B]NES39376.1 trans-aconitate 2-methyltransferase [Micromonospora solifontis]NES55587.1 trans-aconitate 2-methyltransferase [Micromonospora sp. PPF5-6]RNL89181.1 trans-aconitate 2-methyltransferase [Micromonospora solifontis]